MINSQARRLIVVSMISALASSLSGIFVNTFLLRVNDDMIPIAAFNLSVYASAALSFPLFGACSRRLGAPGLQRLGILFQMAYLGGLLLFGRNIGYGIYLCGAMSGLSTAAGGIAGSCLTIAYTRSRDRSVFVSVSGTLTSVIAVISPRCPSRFSAHAASASARRDFSGSGSCSRWRIWAGFCCSAGTSATGSIFAVPCPACPPQPAASQAPV